ncbi:hypothetical protein D3C87_2076260 [compost metagenome]
MWIPSSSSGAGFAVPRPEKRSHTRLSEPAMIKVPAAKVGPTRALKFHPCASISIQAAVPMKNT